MIACVYDAPGWGTGSLLVEGGRVVDHDEPAANLRPAARAGDDPTAADLAGRLAAYYAGAVDDFADVDLEAAWDWHGIPEDERCLLRAVRSIPRGETASYAEVARMAGRPRSWRAAGAACAHGPLSVIVPYHRVIRADGSIGGYGALGAERKRRLLALEGARAR